MIEIDDYSQTVVCDYNGRRYHVRDNGAVRRESKSNSRPSKWDEVWTFGKFDAFSGYMLIGQERVHRIVCTAYHGEPVGDKIVDHIDTNRCNNRPENLRWVTKLENALNNPITRAKIELICGSVEAFLKNPTLLNGHESVDRNFSWMRAVTKEEGERSLKYWNEWAAKPITQRASKGLGVGSWIYGSAEENPRSAFYGFKKWKYAVVDRTEESHFPLSPLSTIAEENVLQKYYDLLEAGKLFFVGRGFKTLVVKKVFFPSENKLRVLSEREGGTKARWYIFEIWPEKDVLMHKITGSYSKKQWSQAQEDVHDLRKYHRQEWKYRQKDIQGRETSQTEIANGKSDSLLLRDYEKELLNYEGIDDTLHDSLTQNAKQQNWRTPNLFVCCPAADDPLSIKKYLNNLEKGITFAKDRYGNNSTILDYGFNENENSIYVLTSKTNGLYPFGLCRVFIQDGVFVHDNVDTFDGADNAKLALTMSLNYK